jgi:hypothetical protein
MGIGLKVARKLIGAAKIKEISFHNPAHRPHLFRQTVSLVLPIDFAVARLFRRMSPC